MFQRFFIHTVKFPSRETVQVLVKGVHFFAPLSNMIDHSSCPFLTSFSHVSPSCVLILHKMFYGQRLRWRTVVGFRNFQKKWVPIPSTETIIKKKANQRLINKLIAKTLIISNPKVALTVCQAGVAVNALHTLIDVILTTTS